MLNLRKMNILKYFLIILVPPLIILGNFRFLIFNGDFYQQIYEKAGVYQSFPDHEIVNAATKNLFGYFQGKDQLNSGFYSQQAGLHLADVREILNFTFGFFYLLLGVVSILGFVMIVRGFKKDLARAFLISSIVTVGAILLLALGILRSFDPFFLKFHLVLFNNQNWLFTKDDNLIKLFPPQFFVAFANRLAVNIAGTSLAIALVSVALLKRVSR